MIGTRSTLSYLCFSLLALGGASLGTGALAAQTPMLNVATTLDLPDAPIPQGADEGISSSQQPAQTGAANPAQAGTPDGMQTKRILGIVPNFRSVSAGSMVPPQTTGDKFKTASQDAFDYSALVVPAVLAAEQQAQNSTPEFRQGAVGYGRYFWHNLADQDIEAYMVEFIVPVMHHEDTRYYTLGKGGFWKRTGYSLSRAVITKSDEGHPIFNAGEIFGAGAAAGISETYYPTRERSFGNTAGKWGTNIGIDAATFVAKEFWPDINKALFHGRE